MVTGVLGTVGLTTTVLGLGRGSVRTGLEKECTEDFFRVFHEVVAGGRRSREDECFGDGGR